MPPINPDQPTPASSRHKAGIALCCLGCLLGLNPYFLLFALPLALGGSYLVLSSAIDQQSKILLAILPYLLPLAFYAALLNS